MVKIKLTSNCYKSVYSAQRSFYSVSGPPPSLSFFAFKNKDVMSCRNLKFLGNGSGPHSVWEQWWLAESWGVKSCPFVGCEHWTAHLHCFLDKHIGEFPFFSLKLPLIVLFLLRYNYTISPPCSSYDPLPFQNMVFYSLTIVTHTCDYTSACVWINM